MAARIDSKELVESYTKQKDWRVKENSNAPFCFGSLGKRMSGAISEDYWLHEIYPEYIKEAHASGFIKLHDLSGLTVYCCGYPLRRVIQEGIHGIPNIPVSGPAKHFMSIVNQLTNITTVFQNEIMGAVAFSNVDTLLAPFIKLEGLNYDQTKQIVQHLVYSINSNSRGGAEPAFSNITLDLTPDADMVNKYVIIGGKELDFTYGDCQEQMDMFNKAFCEVMIAGDYVGQPFSYPIPTYNIHKRFDWDNPNNDVLWEMAGKYGTPYFANFGPHSDMDPADARSMCCRLRLDKRELLRRNGGLFGAGESTGSIGVVTLNLPRIGYIAADLQEAKDLIDCYMDVAKDSLELKRSYLDDVVLKGGLIPAFDTYVGTLENHFSTIGYLGLNEFCVNLIGLDILDEESIRLCEDVLNHMRNRLSDFQEETGHLYNLEATPAESTCYSLALIDKAEFPNIYTQGTEEAPYYTNSCHIPVNKVHSINQVLQHQEHLQKLHTGGTVIHFYMDGPITAQQAKHIVRTAVSKSASPYFSISPVNCYCPDHGHMDKTYYKCPKCGKETDIIQRITGYPRKVRFFNPGKFREFMDRHQLVIEEDNTNEYYDTL